MIDCEHHWNWDKEIRFCLKCRQVRTFPPDGKAGQVLWQGLDDKRNPLEFSAENKSLLAHFAKDIGVKKASDCIKIPMTTLRSWVGAYCRGMAPISKPPVVKRPYHHRVVEPVEVSHNSLEIAPEVVKAVEKLSKSDLEVNLPSFPPFNDNWEAQVQSEWLAAYLELVKFGATK